jgi:predicted nucleotidyltransferase
MGTCERQEGETLTMADKAEAVPTSPTPPDRAASGTIAEMVRRIVEHLHPERVILFGSYAAGLQGPGSDVDLLVIVGVKGAKRSKEVELYRLLAGIGLPKDIVVVTPDDVEEYRHVPGTIIQSALQQGKVLYERSA